MVKLESITGVKETIELDDKTYTIYCNLVPSTPNKNTWECTFPESISLSTIIHIVTLLFSSNILNADYLRFTFKDNKILLKKSNYEDLKDKILSQILN